MPINPRSLIHELREQIRLQDILERGVASRFGAVIKKAGFQAAAGYEATGLVGAHLNILPHRDDLQRLARSALEPTMRMFGRRMIDAVRGEQRDENSIFELTMQQFLAEHALELSITLSETTIEQVRQIIHRGVGQGLGSRAIADLIRKEFTDLSFRRAQMIARTEVHTAANVAADLAAQASRVQGYQRKWLTNVDGRERATHRAANGQTISMTDSFTVGGAKLRFPGDPWGPAREIINCRCAVAFITPDLG